MQSAPSENGGGPVEDDNDNAGSNLTEARVEEWNEVIKSLTECANSVVPIDITTDCGKAVSFSGKDGSGPVEISDTVERLDEEMDEDEKIGLDVIIDTVWWMFSTTYARCYAHFYPNEDIILIFFQMFREDFLFPFLNRWRSAGHMAEHFPIVFGPYDYATSASNARSCCSASYQYEKLAERQLVRPVMVYENNVLMRNFKILNGTNTNNKRVLDNLIRSEQNDLSLD